VHAWLLRQAETYGLGYIPEDHGGQSPAEILAEVRKRTFNIIQELFGYHGRTFATKIGMSVLTMDHVAGKKTSQMTPYHLRLCQLTLMQHINGIRQTLTDVERELWVTMQLTHHPQLDHHTRHALSNLSAYRARHRIRDAQGKPNMTRKEFDAGGWVRMMPARACATLKNPTADNLYDATLKEIQAQVESGVVNATWDHLERKGRLPDNDPLDPAVVRKEKHRKRMADFRRRSPDAPKGPKFGTPEAKEKARKARKSQAQLEKILKRARQERESLLSEPPKPPRKPSKSP